MREADRLRRGNFACAIQGPHQHMRIPRAGGPLRFGLVANKFLQRHPCYSSRSLVDLIETAVRGLWMGKRFSYRFFRSRAAQLSLRFYARERFAEYCNLRWRLAIGRLISRLITKPSGSPRRIKTILHSERVADYAEQYASERGMSFQS